MRPSQRSAHQPAMSGRWRATSSQVRSPWSLTGETSSRPSGTSPGSTGSSANGSSFTAGGEGSSTLASKSPPRMSVASARGFAIARIA